MIFAYYIMVVEHDRPMSFAAFDACPSKPISPVVIELATLKKIYKYNGACIEGHRPTSIISLINPLLLL